MKKLIYIGSAVFINILLVSFISKTNDTPEVAYPGGYRSWTHVKSAIIAPPHPNFKYAGGYHHLYANTLAMEGYETGKFPQGSVLVADFLEMVDNGTTIDEAKRRFVDVMLKDTLIYKSTGGWGFAEFDGDSKTLRRMTQANAYATCFSCHARQSATDYVFSKYRP